MRLLFVGESVPGAVLFETLGKLGAFTELAVLQGVEVLVGLQLALGDLKHFNCHIGAVVRTALVSCQQVLQNKAVFHGAQAVTQTAYMPGFDFLDQHVYDLLLRLYLHSLIQVVGLVSLHGIADHIEHCLLQHRQLLHSLLGEADIAALAASVEKQRVYAAEGNSKAFMDEDSVFHRYILEKNRNQEILATVNGLYDRAYMLGITNSKGMRPAQSVAEHEKVLEALKRGDRQGFADAIEENILNGFRNLINHL